MNKLIANRVYYCPKIPLVQLFITSRLMVSFIRFTIEKLLNAHINLASYNQGAAHVIRIRNF